MSDILNLLSGFAQGFSQARQARMDRDEQKELLSLKKDAMKLELQKAKAEAEQRKFLLDIFASQGIPGLHAGGQAQDPYMSDSLTGLPTEQKGPGVVDQIVGSQMGGMLSVSPEIAIAMKAAGGPDLFPYLNYNRSKQSDADRLAESRRSNDIRERGQQFAEQKVSYQDVMMDDGSIISVPMFADGTPAMNRGPLMKQLAPVESRTVPIPGGGKGTQVFDKRTNKPVSGVVETEKPTAVPAETASKITLAAKALKMMPEIRRFFINDDGTLNKTVALQAAAPGGGIGRGRQAIAMFMDAIDARIRAATGAAVTKEEWPAYFKMYLPSVLDNAETSKNKLDRLEAFLSGYLETLDPTGDARGRMSSQEQKADFVYNPKTGKLEPAK